MISPIVLFVSDHLLMPLDVRIISTLFEDVIGALFHFNLEGHLTGTLDFLDSFLLSLEHLLGFDKLAVSVLSEKGLNRIIRVNGLLALHEAPGIAASLIVGGLTARRFLGRVN